jgi:hypothetical protein
MKGVLFILMLAVTAGFAQPAGQKKAAPKSAAPAVTRWPIEKLTVEGNRYYTRE